MKKINFYAIKAFLFIILITVDNSYSFSQITKKELKTEADGFKWYQTKSNKRIEGALNKDGQVIIPLNRGYSAIYYVCRLDNQSEGYFRDCRKILRKFITN